MLLKRYLLWASANTVNSYRRIVKAIAMGIDRSLQADCSGRERCN
jgi:hypothetical protein